MTSNRFDTITFLYDPLVKLIFGKAHERAQKIFLNEIPPIANVLILGGGTGDILVELLNIKPSCKIYYVDASKKMILKAKKKTNNFNTIHFIHGTQDNIPDHILFNVVITNFYLDLFTTATLKAVIEKIDKSLHQNSQWYITDFVDNGEWWQRIMLKAMYLFFKITCNIEGDHLPLWEDALYLAGFRKEKTALFYNRFMKSELYIREKTNCNLPSMIC